MARQIKMIQVHLTTKELIEARDRIHDWYEGEVDELIYAKGLQILLEELYEGDWDA